MRALNSSIFLAWFMSDTHTASSLLQPFFEHNFLNISIQWSAGAYIFFLSNVFFPDISCIIYPILLKRIQGDTFPHRYQMLTISENIFRFAAKKRKWNLRLMGLYFQGIVGKVRRYKNNFVGLVWWFIHCLIACCGDIKIPWPTRQKRSADLLRTYS